MTAPTPSTRSDAWIVGVVAAAILALAITERPASTVLGTLLPALDFGLFAVVLAAAVRGRGRTPLEAVALAATGSIAYAVAVEAVQWTVRLGRIAAADVLAASIGAILGAWGWWLYGRWWAR